MRKFFFAIYFIVLSVPVFSQQNAKTSRPASKKLATAGNKINDKQVQLPQPSPSVPRTSLSMVQNSPEVQPGISNPQLPSPTKGLDKGEFLHTTKDTAR